MRIAKVRIMASIQRMSMRTRLHSFRSAAVLASIALLLSPGYSAVARPSPQAGELAFQVKDITIQADSTASSLPNGLVRVGNVVYFTAHDEATGRELWKSDGT